MKIFSELINLILYKSLSQNIKKLPPMHIFARTADTLGVIISCSHFCNLLSIFYASPNTQGFSLIFSLGVLLKRFSEKKERLLLSQH